MKHDVSILPLALSALLAACGGTKSNGNGSSGGNTSGTTGSSTTGTDASTSTTGSSTTGSDGSSTTSSTTGMASTTTGGGTGSTCDATGTTMLMASEASNYTFSSTLSFPPISVKPDSELTFEWGGLTQDFLKHPLDVSTDINAVNVMLWTLTQSDLEQKLNDDTLVQSDLAIIASLYPEGGATSGSLLDLTSGGGMALDPDQIMPFVNADTYPPDSNIYTAMTATGTDLKAGTRMIQSFKLDPTSDNTVVTISDTSTVLDYQVDLESLQSLAVPMSDPSIVIDWANMTTNGLGQEFVKNSINRIAVAHYDKTPADLAADFLSLVNYDGSVNADQLWEADVESGSCFSLADLTDDSGGAFPGIDGTGTWMIALFCGGCQNPAPWYLSFLTPG